MILHKANENVVEAVAAAFRNICGSGICLYAPPVFPESVRMRCSMAPIELSFPYALFSAAYSSNFNISLIEIIELLL